MDVAEVRASLSELLKPPSRGAAGEEGRGEAAAELRAALAAPKAPGLGRLVEAARQAGELDDALVAELLRRGRPARAFAGFLGGVPSRPGSPVARALGELTGRHLGGDPRRWRGLHDALGTARAALPDLLAARPVPADGTPPLPPRSVTDTLALLLEHAAPPHAAAALTALPDRTVDTLLARGTLPGPALTAAVVAHGDTRSRAALARHPRIDSRVLKDLVAADDPVVNASVYRNQRCPASLRRAITHALHRVPLDASLRAELLSPATDDSRSLAAPLLACGDPELVPRALRWGVRKVAQRYALLRVWECRGPETLRAVLADAEAMRYVHREVRADVAAALGEPDGATRLRAEGEPYEDPAALPRLLSTSRGTSTLRDLLNEPYAHDMRALAAANRRAPFMPKAAEELVRHEDATDAERAEFRLTLLNAAWRAGGRIAGNLTPPARRLEAESLDGSAGEWAVGMVRAGLLDPVLLVTAARPAAHAVGALRAVAADGLWTDGARAAFAALCEDTVGTRPHAWEALLTSLPAHPGTPAEALQDAARQEPTPAPAHPARAAELPGAEAAEPVTAEEPAALDGAVAPGGVVPRQGAVAGGEREPSGERAPSGEPVVADSPGEPDDPVAPEEPVGRLARCALGALDLLVSLAPDGAATLPEDRGVLRYLAAHREGVAPAWRHPGWLWRACEDQGLGDLVHPCETPTREEALAWLREHDGSEAEGRIADRAYLYGVLDADDLLHHLPAARLLTLPYGWEDLAFTTAWRRAVAAFLDRELGTDADAWLALAAIARDVDATASWPELLHRSRRAGRPSADVLRKLCAVADGGQAPTDPEAASRLLARGNHLWEWPLGALLCEAREETVAAVLPRFGPDGPWLLAAYLLRRTPTPHGPFAHLLDLRDPAALRLLSEQHRWLSDGSVLRLLDLADPDVDLALLRTSHDRAVLRRLAARKGPAAARLAADLRADPRAEPPGGSVWLESAEPDLVEYVLARSGKRLNLAQQLVGCMSLLRHGGPERLAALADSGVLGATATRLCRKALASDDPQSPLADRLRRELGPDRIVKRLRRARSRWETRAVIDTSPGPLDWDALEAAHHEEPLPAWEELVRGPEAPHGIRLRHAAHLPAPSPHGTPLGRELTVARLRHGIGFHHRRPVDALLDRLLETGQLTGRDLVHEAAPAAVVLAYLNRARRRRDAPAEVRAAVAETERLVRERLGDDPGAWRRVAARLTEREPAWEAHTPVPALLSVR
ncbi:hypothetical protein [Streptomyces thermolilacinus]|uniref:Uncharacterized protein n=1 Tax=Streptomyces thermolilacinus SPC6 TaxID=1306406 RepID=A0A1D3DZ03_9ACTN|nr:hypothetical protein [Streptomyces thermolilacinus]OEJ97559.1 hypothetical protein J116_026995 [Streptomyces thermolilacinus SPC6]